MKILLKCTSSDENLSWCQYALVELADEHKKEVLLRRELYQMAHGRDSSLWTMSYWGIPGEFYDTMNIEELLTDEQQADFEAKEFIVLPEQMAEKVSLYAQFFDNLEVARTECDRMELDDDGFWWKCLVKHTSVYIETARLPFEMVL